MSTSADKYVTLKHLNIKKIYIQKKSLKNLKTFLNIVFYVIIYSYSLKYIYWFEVIVQKIIWFLVCSGREIEKEFAKTLAKAKYTKTFKSGDKKSYICAHCKHTCTVAVINHSIRLFEISNKRNIF